MNGTCALCKNDAELQNSHLIPQWAYKRVLRIDLAGAKAPALIAGGSAVLSNKQKTQHLLCFECEQRFSKCEDYVATLTEPNGAHIKLFDRVRRAEPPAKVVGYLNTPEDAEQLAYFGASVLWRGYAMTGACKLGPYGEGFRQYLLGAAGFPAEAVMSVGLFDPSPDVDVRGWVSEPASTKANFAWLHGFLIAGLAFRCWVSNTLPRQWQQISLAGPNPAKYVSIVKPEDCPDFLAAAEFAAAAEPRGKLAKL